MKMNVGDIVADQAGLQGRLVANIDRGQFSQEYPQSEWAYLATRLLVDTPEAGLVHYKDAEDLTLLSDA